MKTELLPHPDTFTEAAEGSSFTAALGLTQAAVSRRVQALERELGVPLFAAAGRSN
jgi:DNA-binding transcriptional LysR family regulator